jgi:molybdate transport system substrate-binding protein
MRLLSRSLVTLALLAAAWGCPAADVTVSAAASLRDAFTDIARAFEQRNKPHRVLLNTGASGQLLQQISRGAPVDVFASADQDTMDKAQRQGLLVAGTRVNFVGNRLVLAVTQDMASPPKSLDELGRADIQRIAIGTPESVPAGRYAKAALDAAGQWQRLSQRLVNTQNVRQALDYVARGEVDAGFVYATDAQLLSARVRVAFEVPTAEPIVYPIAVIKGGGNERLGQTFVAYVRGDEARAILRKYGFDPI